MLSPQNICHENICPLLINTLKITGGVARGPNEILARSTVFFMSRMITQHEIVNLHYLLYFSFKWYVAFTPRGL